MGIIFSQAVFSGSFCILHTNFSDIYKINLGVLFTLSYDKHSFKNLKKSPQKKSLKKHQQILIIYIMYTIFLHIFD